MRKTPLEDRASQHRGGNVQFPAYLALLQLGADHFQSFSFMFTTFSSRAIIILNLKASKEMKDKRAASDYLAIPLNYIMAQGEDGQYPAHLIPLRLRTDQFHYFQWESLGKK